MASQNDSKKIYEALRSIPADEFQKMKAEDIGKLLQKTADSATPLPFNTETSGHIYIIAGKVAHQASEEEFKDFFETGEAPPVKLTPKEMDILKGGGGNKDPHRTFSALFNRIIVATYALKTGHSGEEALALGQKVYEQRMGGDRSAATNALKSLIPETPAASSGGRGLRLRKRGG